jgi:hypothetical protein
MAKIRRPPDDSTVGLIVVFGFLGAGGGVTGISATSPGECIDLAERKSRLLPSHELFLRMRLAFRGGPCLLGSPDVLRQLSTAARKLVISRKLDPAIAA